MTREDAIRSLAEYGRFPAVKYCIFHPRSPIWTSSLKDDLLALIRRGQEEHVIYANVRHLFDLLTRGLESGVDSIGAHNIKQLLSNDEFVPCVWKTVTSREIQYRMQISFIRARQSLIDNGVPEAAMPLTAELQSRLEEEKRPTARPDTTPGENVTTPHAAVHRLDA